VSHSEYLHQAALNTVLASSCIRYNIRTQLHKINKIYRTNLPNKLHLHQTASNQKYKHQTAVSDSQSNHTLHL
jgi:hypothetical protein